MLSGKYKASIRCAHLQFLESTPFKFQRKQHTWGSFCPLMGRPNQADDESCAGHQEQTIDYKISNEEKIKIANLSWC